MASNTSVKKHCNHRLWLIFADIVHFLMALSGYIVVQLIVSRLSGTGEPAFVFSSLLWGLTYMSITTTAMKEGDFSPRNENVFLTAATGLACGFSVSGSFYFLYLVWLGPLSVLGESILAVVGSAVLYFIRKWRVVSMQKAARQAAQQGNHC